MELKPIIASYKGYRKQIVDTLDESYFSVIKKLLDAPIRKNEINEKILNELIAMHVVKIDDQLIKLDTAVFLEEDIKKVSKLAYKMGYGLGECLVNNGSKLNETSSEIRNFLGDVVGISQGISKLLKENKLIIDWKSYSGKYDSTKVDFDEICNAYTKLPFDYQNKTTVKGIDYTAVNIGISGHTFESRLQEVFLSNNNSKFGINLLGYLTDSFANLLLGRIENKSLEMMAKEVNLYKDGKPRDCVITPVIYNEFQTVVKQISNISYQYYYDYLDEIIQCLKSTISGLQGVSPENMMMHFWRYCRRTLAKSLYDSRLFTDDVIQNGTITVFYDNSIEDLVRML